eukprot:10390443-Alexandrium_andersonii.AAC.1
MNLLKQTHTRAERASASRSTSSPLACQWWMFMERQGSAQAAVAARVLAWRTLARTHGQHTYPVRLTPHGLTLLQGWEGLGIQPGVIPATPKGDLKGSTKLATALTRM